MHLNGQINIMVVVVKVAGMARTALKVFLFTYFKMGTAIITVHAIIENIHSLIR